MICINIMIITSLYTDGTMIHDRVDNDKWDEFYRINVNGMHDNDDDKCNT